VGSSKTVVFEAANWTAMRLFFATPEFLTACVDGTLGWIPKKFQKFCACLQVASEHVGAVFCVSQPGYGRPAENFRVVLNFF
jgi:hypothetical protein